jgi:hypothetical protein
MTKPSHGAHDARSSDPSEHDELMETLRLVRLRLNQMIEGRALREFTYQDVVEYQVLTDLESALLSPVPAHQRTPRFRTTSRILIATPRGHVGSVDGM